MKNYSEFCEEQANKLFTVIENHQGLLEWKKTWSVQGCMGLPKGVAGLYSGINLWSLLAEQIQEGYGSAIWLTFNQIKQKGGHVLKGAKGTKVCFFKMKEIIDEAELDREEPKLVPIFRGYTVFNLDQTSLAGQNAEVVENYPDLEKLKSLLNVHVSEFGQAPHYQPSEDVIVMPKRQFFNSSDDYDITFLHELVHWTGGSSRLNRESIRNYSKSKAYRAEEELVAEIGSVFLSSYFGIMGNLVNHASYVQSWKKHLDAKSIGRAMSQASKAFEWLIGHLEPQETEAAA